VLINSFQVNYIHLQLEELVTLIKQQSALIKQQWYGHCFAPVITKPASRCLYLVKATTISLLDTIVVVVRKAVDFVKNRTLMWS